MLEIGETVKNHLISLGCILVPDERKKSYHLWEIELPKTDAGVLNISFFETEYQFNFMMFAGKFEKPENFRKAFCEANHINPFSGKWNDYVDVNNPDSLTELLRYYSRMIPILDNE
jgi:hypothetical protein